MPLRGLIIIIAKTKPHVAEIPKAIQGWVEDMTNLPKVVYATNSSKLEAQGNLLRGDMLKIC
jgi:hypothetical protein